MMIAFTVLRCVRVCSGCHGAAPPRHKLEANDFCCERCPQFRRCYHGRKLLGFPYAHLTPHFTVAADDDDG